VKQDSREALAEALRVEHAALNICYLHAEPLFFDAPQCPCCELMREMNMRELGRHREVIR